MKIYLYAFGSPKPIKEFDTILQAKEEAKKISYTGTSYFVLEDFDGTMIHVDTLDLINAFTK